MQSTRMGRRKGRRKGRRQRRRIQRRRAEERLPRKLIPQVLLRLYDVFSDDDPQRGKVLRRTLAACRLVCREWSWIVTPKRSWFIIRVDGKEWASCSWYRVRRPPLQLQDGRRRDQEGDTGWCTQNYKEDLMKSHPKFLPELTRNILPGFYKCGGTFYWEDEKKSIIQSTLAACCLVSHEWNRIFTPMLYENIILGGKKSLLTRSLLHRTFQHTKPTHKALVKTITIELAKDGSPANSLSICFSLPNLHKLIIYLSRVEVDPATLHSNFAQNLQSLSRRCAIQMRGDYKGEIDTRWQSLPIWISFFRRSRSIPCGFFAFVSGGGYWISFIFPNHPTDQ